MPPWLSELLSIQRKESACSSSRWVQLATIGVDNTARVRTVVFRGWSELYEMQIYTDSRSQKHQELDSNNNVEICWLFSKSKCQFRFRGTSRIDLGKDRFSHWAQLSQNSKSMWSWPSPGDQYDLYNNNVLSVDNFKDVSNNFNLLKIDITHVEQLLLHIPIHTRRRWIRKKEWIEDRINP